MPKKIKFESFKYRFLAAAREGAWRPSQAHQTSWAEFINALEFSYEAGGARVAWSSPTPGSVSFSLSDPHFYTRGDSEKFVFRQHEANLLDGEDPIKGLNDVYFKSAVMLVAKSACFTDSAVATRGDVDRLDTEREFHDAWADSEDVEAIDVRAANQACTAPEMRYITNRLGDIRGKRLLDIGCGLGEASVYFALLGADVTSSDLSQGMLDVTNRLATANGVVVKQHIAAAEDMQLPQDALFDIVYAGNLLHHVEIDSTIARVKPHLADGGMFVTWDPLAYNPAINVYRALATEVRTPDEHPLTWKDIKLFEKHFSVVETKYFWLTTLLIFVLMAVAQRRSPNRERYWKVVVQEGERWRWLYTPLEKLDAFLLALFPPLRLLCWNVVVICRK